MTMNEQATPLTLAEREIEIERRAIARYVCRRGRQPNARGVGEEVQTMHSEAAHGKSALPDMTPAAARAWLLAKGLDAPKLDTTPKV
jgi:hypothetical protein